MSQALGLDIEITADPMDFRYGPGVTGPAPEYRPLDAIRRSLRDPDCSGPDPVYAIVMDIAREEHRAELRRRNLLFGAVTYAAGRLGREPVRSQGHVHKVSAHSGWMPPEIYEIWDGRAYVYMQEFVADEPGRSIVYQAVRGDVVVVPPGWAHATISADPSCALTFGAWCDRDYGFHYEEVRARRGMAWYAVLGEAERMEWEPNPRYGPSKIEVRPARRYPELGLKPGTPIYEQFARNPESVQWVSQPARVKDVWAAFQP